MVTHWQCSSSFTCTDAHGASSNSDLHYLKREVNGGIQQQAYPRRAESASPYSFTSSYFSNPDSAVCGGYNLTVPHTFMTSSLVNVQGASDCLNVNQGTALPIPGSSAGMEALSSYMEQLRLGAAALSDQSFVDYSPAKAGNPCQFRQATFNSYIPTQGFPDVNSQQYFSQPRVRTSPDIARSSPYDTRWIYRDPIAGQIQHKPLIRSATKRSSKKMRSRTGMSFKPSNVVKKPRVVRSRSCIDRRGESSGDNLNTNIESSFRLAAHIQIYCNYGCGRVFSQADGCKRHMSFCPFRTEK